MEHKTLTVGAYRLFLPGLLHSIAAAGGFDVAARRSILLVRLVRLPGGIRCNEGIHFVHHGLHIGLVCRLHMGDLFCVLVLQHRE